MDASISPGPFYIQAFHWERGVFKSNRYNYYTAYRRKPTFPKERWLCRRNGGQKESEAFSSSTLACHRQKTTTIKTVWSRRKKKVYVFRAFDESKYRVCCLQQLLVNKGRKSNNYMEINDVHSNTTKTKFIEIFKRTVNVSCEKVDLQTLGLTDIFSNYIFKTERIVFYRAKQLIICQGINLGYDWYWFSWPTHNPYYMNKSK